MAKLKDTRVYGYLNVDSGVSISGVLTASTYKGDGSGLTGIVGSGSGVIVKDDGSTVGTAGTINFGEGLSVSPISAGIVTVTGTAGGGSSQWVTTNAGIHTLSNVGVGTTNPVASLTVVPSSASIAGLFSGTTSDDMIRITQLGIGNALKVEDSTNPDLTPFVIDANGYIGIGTDAINSTQGSITRLNIHAGSSYGGLRITNPTDGSGVLRGLLLAYSSADNAYLMSSLDRQIHLNTTGVEPLVLQPIIGRRVGIGSILPNNKLDIIGSTYISDNLGIGTTNPTTKLDVSGSFGATETRIKNVAEKLTRVNGNTVSIAYTGGGGNIGFATNPTGDITLNVTGIPTDSSFDNYSITFSVIVNQTGTARSCTAVTLNGVSRTIKWSGGSLANAISGVTTTSGYDIYNFTGINTVGSASTTSNYEVLGVVNGGFR
jgi:hypothetical protein